MPASPKSQKKAGAPKAKGAVRAKSGCYTCRIRRKKCDEQQNQDGHCQTCIRLRLECLGFGAKRPDWLRDNRNVLELREKIKGHLAAQGMIKGHSGSGPRNAEQDPPVLRLHDEYNSSTASPPTPTLSIDDHRTHGLITSSIRDDSYPLAMESYHSPALQSQVQELSPDSPRSQMFPNDVMLPPYQPHVSLSSHNLVPLVSSGWSHNTLSLPALESSFGQLYNKPFEDDEYPDGGAVSDGSHYPPFINAQFFANSDGHNRLVNHYVNRVVGIQYLLVDPMVRDVILSTIETSATARKALYLLSNLHRTRIEPRFEFPDLRPQYSELYQSLLIGKSSYDEGDAMAGLHIVSAFLFDGGKGDWQNFIDVACHFSRSTLYDARHNGPTDVLMNCGETTRFIIKTTMWFDVLASASRRKPPHFLQLFRSIFNPTGASIDGSLARPPSQMCMLPIMGCANYIVWALAEISSLAYWKDEQLARGQLSIMELVQRGREIERYLLIPSHQEASRRYGDQDTFEKRRLTSEVFRASARVYLHSVLSGDYPSCPEIAEGVEDTIECLKAVKSPAMTRSVVRSAVFSIFICGCLTDKKEQRDFLYDRLKAEEAESVGNCPEVMKVMEKVWQQRQPHSTQPVLWQEALRKSQLLLV